MGVGPRTMNVWIFLLAVIVCTHAAKTDSRYIARNLDPKFLPKVKDGKISERGPPIVPIAYRIRAGGIKHHESSNTEFGQRLATRGFAPDVAGVPLSLNFRERDWRGMPPPPGFETFQETREREILAREQKQLAEGQLPAEIKKLIDKEAAMEANMGAKEIAAEQALTPAEAHARRQVMEAGGTFPEMDKIELEVKMAEERQREELQQATLEKEARAERQAEVAAMLERTAEDTSVKISPVGIVSAQRGVHPILLSQDPVRDKLRGIAPSISLIAQASGTGMATISTDNMSARQLYDYRKQLSAQKESDQLRSEWNRGVGAPPTHDDGLMGMEPAPWELNAARNNAAASQDTAVGDAMSATGTAAAAGSTGVGVGQVLAEPTEDPGWFVGPWGWLR